MWDYRIWKRNAPGLEMKAANNGALAVLLHHVIDSIRSSIV